MASASKMLLFQQGLFTKMHSANDGIARDSYVMSHNIAKHSKTFSEGESIDIMFN
jgi:hypothetical protein